MFEKFKLVLITKFEEKKCFSSFHRCRIGVLGKGATCPDLYSSHVQAAMVVLARYRPRLPKYLYSGCRTLQPTALVIRVSL